MLPAAQRFVVLAAFNNAAVRDNETGLVWEQSPRTETEDWPNARLGCARKFVGNRLGWRLPSIPELASLLDPSVADPGPTLPAGHPFTGVQPALYWSATTGANDPEYAWVVSFSHGYVASGFKARNRQVWCVRGGMNTDMY